jgi:hypothetical protein
MELTKLGFAGAFGIGGKVAINGLCEGVVGVKITSDSDLINISK